MPSKLTENPMPALAEEFKKAAMPENTPKASAATEGLSGATMDLLERSDCLDKNGKLKYNIVEANGCIYLVDPLNPDLKPGEEAVYPHHDEAAELLKAALSLNERFDTVIDAFRGGGHSNLPILRAEIAGRAKSIDINPRALWLSRINAFINGMRNRTEDMIGDTAKELPPKEGKTIFVANPPFALAVKGVHLDKMRDGGENGLVLTIAYLEKAIRAAESGDVVIGVAYSRIGFDGKIELEQHIKVILGDQGTYTLEIVEGEKLWRGPEGKKEQPNPMPLANMHTKAKPDDPAAIRAYNEAAEFHKAQGWEKLGYFRYVIRIDKKSKGAEETREAVKEIL